jgi:hypothetical protein
MLHAREKYDLINDRLTEPIIVFIYAYNGIKWGITQALPEKNILRTKCLSGKNKEVEGDKPQQKISRPESGMFEYPDENPEPGLITP